MARGRLTYKTPCGRKILGKWIPSIKSEYDFACGMRNILSKEGPLLIDAEEGLIILMEDIAGNTIIEIDWED